VHMKIPLLGVAFFFFNIKLGCNLFPNQKTTLASRAFAPPAKQP